MLMSGYIILMGGYIILIGGYLRVGSLKNDKYQLVLGTLGVGSLVKWEISVITCE